MIQQTAGASGTTGPKSRSIRKHIVRYMACVEVEVWHLVGTSYTVEKTCCCKRRTAKSKELFLELPAGSYSEEARGMVVATSSSYY